MKTLESTNGYLCQVSDIDFEYVWQFSWSCSKKGKFQGTAHPVSGMYLHRVIAERAGMVIDSLQVDHRDRNPANNQRSNLRVATNGLNRANSKLNSNNKSGFKGVHLRRKRPLIAGRKRRNDYSGDRWMAQINVDGKKIFLGDFDTPEEAHEAYKKAALKHFGEFANPVRKIVE